MGSVFPSGGREPSATSQLGESRSHGGLTPTARESIWLVRDGAPLPEWIESPPILSAPELARAESIRHPRAKAQFIRGRTVLRAALALRLGCLPADIPLRLSPDGKPFLDPAEVGRELHFNMSHTDGFALFAISEYPIGVDIEVADPKRDCDGLVRRFFTPVEQDEYFALAEHRRTAAFLRGWTCKEALLKAIGSGVRDLQDCAVRMNPDAPPAVLCAPGDAAWKLEAGEVEAGVAWAVARTSRSA